MTESEKMEVKRMYQEGVSISELSRRTGHDRKTIRKVVQEREGIEKPLVGTKREVSWSRISHM
ncbi:transposase [Alicyclobacillus cycloheptanicus]|uniref:Transposase n=1 Tax=Alicyclobacillus cycloheptanicus TaxID=1457 RepID=A0ABT9XKT0_9BACL|nr:transposase [Alicyclobacillus cycloheptanicus]